MLVRGAAAAACILSMIPLAQAQQNQLVAVWAQSFGGGRATIAIENRSNAIVERFSMELASTQSNRSYSHNVSERNILPGTVRYYEIPNTDTIYSNFTLQGMEVTCRFRGTGEDCSRSISYRPPTTPLGNGGRYYVVSPP